MFDVLFKRAFIVAVITDLTDFLFHFLFTNPMESLTYFVIKFLLAFFVAAALFSSGIYLKKIDYRKYIVIAAGLIFSTLMSIYYRAWELSEAGVPFGTRAPDIIGITRYTILFSAIWWLAHASFFAVGAGLAAKIKNRATAWTTSPKP